jgi:hypothetical protein
MRIHDIKIGQKVRFENQKWIGIVQDICNKFNEVTVVFEGDGELELVDAKYIRSAY